MRIPYHTIQYIIILEHQSKVGDPDTFDIKVKRVFKKCLDRQVMEGVMIGATELENRLNSRAEYLQPSVVRVGATRELECTDKEEENSWTETLIEQSSVLILCWRYRSRQESHN